MWHRKQSDAHVQATQFAAASRNHVGTDSRAWSHRATTEPQNLMVLPMRKWGMRPPLHQRCKVSGVTLSIWDSSETLRAESELRRRSAIDRGAALIVGGNHLPSGCDHCRFAVEGRHGVSTTPYARLAASSSLCSTSGGLILQTHYNSPLRHAQAQMQPAARRTGRLTL